MNFNHKINLALTMLILVCSCGKKSQDPTKDSIKIVGPKTNIESSKTAYEIKAAANKDNVEEVKYLLSKSSDLDIDIIFQDGETLLTSSIKTNSANVTELLLEKEANIIKPNSSGETPLILATKNDNIELITRIIELLKRKTLINHIDDQDQDGRTALFHAILSKYNDLALFYINQGANVDIYDNNGTTPLKIAQELGLKSVVSMIQSKNETNKGFPSKKNLLDLLTYGDSNLLQAVLAKYPNTLFEYESESPLIIIAANSNPDEAIAMSVMALKYRSKVDGPNKASTSPLIEAIKNDRMYLAELYLQYNANPNRVDAEGNSPLYWAIDKINLMAVNLLQANFALENYSYWIHGKRISFNACTKVKQVRKSLIEESKKVELKKIQDSLRCGRVRLF